MRKIKISTIALMACLLITFIFDALVPVWLGISFGAISIVMFILLNIEMFKVKGLTRNPIIYADLTVGLFLILTFIPTGLISYGVNNLISHSLVFVFAVLLITMLVNAYRMNRKD